MPSDIWWGLLCVGAGLIFSLMVLAYELGRLRHVDAPQIAFCVAMAGVIAFGLRCLLTGEGVAVPWRVALLGLAAGGFQAVSTWMIRPARSRGPFTPINAALNMAFVPASIYALSVLHHKLTTVAALGLVLSVGCVVAGSLAAGGEKPANEPVGCVYGRSTARTRLEYVAFLVLMVVFVGVSGIAILYLTSLPLGDGGDWFQRFKDAYFLYLYVGFLLPTAISMSGVRRVAHVVDILGLGFLASFGSVVGMNLLGYAARLPAGIGFASVCVSAIVGGALVCALMFDEKRSAAWYASLACAVLAVLCFNLKL